MKATVNWKEILIFYLIAVLVSAPFRLGYVHLETLVSLPYGLNMFYSIFRGIGPAVGAFVVYRLLKSKVKPQLTFWGSNKIIALIAVATIPVGLGIVGVNDVNGMPDHYNGFLTGIVLIFYALGEELGWRVYLQPALSPIPKFYRVLIIALLWFTWHLNFLRPGISPSTHLIHFISILAGSWGLLKISEVTKSLVFVVAVHLSFNVLSDVNCNNKLVLLGVIAGIWALLIFYLQNDKDKSGVVAEGESRI